MVVFGVAILVARALWPKPQPAASFQTYAMDLAAFVVIFLVVSEFSSPLGLSRIGSALLMGAIGGAALALILRYANRTKGA